MKGTTKTAVGYVRASTDEQYLGPEDQRARIEAWCVAYGYELLDVYEDRGVSGGVALEKRPEGQHVHELIHGRRATADVLVVTRLDRLTRDAGDGLAIIKKLTPKRRRSKEMLSLVALDEHIDLSTSFMRFAAKLRFQIAEFERELIGERTSDALQHKKRTDRVYGRARFGWDRDGDNLVVNEDEQAALRLMREQREAGASYGAIAALLIENGVPTKRGGQWRAMTVYQILNDDREEAA